MLQVDRLWNSISTVFTTRQSIALFSIVIGLITGNTLTTNNLLRVTFAEDNFPWPTLEFGTKPTHATVEEIIKPEHRDNKEINNVLGDKGFFRIDLMADRINKHHEARYRSEDKSSEKNWTDHWFMQVDSTLRENKHFHIFDEGLIDNLETMKPHDPLIRKLHSMISDPEGPFGIHQILVEFAHFDEAEAAACTSSGFYKNDVALIRQQKPFVRPYLINVGVSNAIGCSKKRDEDICRQWDQDDPIARKIISKNNRIQISFEDAAKLFPEKIQIDESGKIVKNNLRRCEVASAYLTKEFRVLNTN